MESVYPHPRQTQQDSLQGGFSQGATGVSTEALSQLPSFLREQLDNSPIAGKGVYKWISCVACHLLPQFNERSTFTLIKAETAGCEQHLEKLELEIANQIQSAFPRRWQPRYARGFARYRAKTISRARELEQ